MSVLSDFCVAQFSSASRIRENDEKSREWTYKAGADQTVFTLGAFAHVQFTGESVYAFEALSFLPNCLAHSSRTQSSDRQNRTLVSAGGRVGGAKRRGEWGRLERLREGV